MNVVPPALSPEESIRRVARARSIVLQEIRKVVVGQDRLVDQILMATFSGGHCLVDGSPGSGRALVAQTLAKVLHLSFRQLHGHPQLTAEDIVGREIAVISSPAEPPLRRLDRGPIFSNLLLVDEFERANHHAQEVLLQPLLEHRIAAAGSCYDLPSPFLLIATRNTNERQQVFPMSDAVGDRFLFCLRASIPERDTEREIARHVVVAPEEVRQVLRVRDVLWIQEVARRIVVTQHIIDYVVDLVRATRPESRESPRVLRNWLARGAGTRAVHAILVAAKTRAMIHGRCAVHSADVRAVLPDTLRHRVQWQPQVADTPTTIEHVVEVLVRIVPENCYGDPTGAPPELEVIDPGDQLPPSVVDESGLPATSP